MGWGNKQKQIETADELDAVLEESVAEAVTDQQVETHFANIGRSVYIKGEFHSNEDVTIEGTIEGRVTVNDGVLGIGPTGAIKGDVVARSVHVEGNVEGNVIGLDLVEVAATGSVKGDIRATRVVLAEGARFKGAIDMGTEPELPEMPEIPGRPTMLDEQSSAEDAVADLAAALGDAADDALSAALDFGGDEVADSQPVMAGKKK